MNQTSFLRNLALGCIFLAGACFASSLAAEPDPYISVSPADGKVIVKAGDRLFTEYHYKDVPRPFLYPLYGPGELPMTRNWPMKDTGGEEKDHPHHKSFWFTHGDVNGVDFWADGDSKGKIQHAGFLKLCAGNEGVIQTSNRWVAPSGKVICTDSRTLRFQVNDSHRIIDYLITLYASNGEVTFGDTKEGSMALRLAETMRLKGKVGQGHIVNSAGDQDGKTWGKRAAWCDYYGPVNDQIVGVAIFDHPSNPRHPTWWHVRDYGLFAANPFGIHDFEKKPAGTGDLRLPAGEQLTFKYRFLFHRGNEKEGKVAEHYQEFSSLEK